MPRRALKENQVFGTLSDANIDGLIANSIARNYTDGEWITHYGDIWPYLFFVEKGEIEAVKESHDGKSLIVMESKAGDVFWGVGFFLDEVKMPVALVARRDSRLLLWHRDRILPLLHSNGRLSWELARLMATLMRNVSEIVDDLAFQPVTGRLARLLLVHFGSSGDGYVSRDMTLDEMASRIGSTREVVCRQLYRFADEGLIQINRTELMIANREKLEQQANQAAREV